MSASATSTTATMRPCSPIEDDFVIISHQDISEADCEGSYVILDSPISPTVRQQKAHPTCSLDNADYVLVNATHTTPKQQHTFCGTGYFLSKTSIDKENTIKTMEESYVIINSASKARRTA
ncbi:hypothetical protein CVT24_010475 [Panaeolus cyanescens]|uniref:Uncharacterized protein n=1 Tax=Panaeolus cyanescens TaxID=181874 RepID=A0A409WAW6_9AGAR|nr:hypothetical protein CVT24_010475 [Panaeolus cyanescens]